MARRPGPPPAYAPALYDLADAYAVRAVASGTADSEQQRRAMRWIIEQAAGTYDAHYRPEGDRDTSFALGRAHVGQQAVKLINLPGEVLDAMRQGPKRGEPSEQS